MTSDAYSYQFSGHETFPLRQLWLHKIHKYVRAKICDPKSISFSSEEAMIELGVGKNMLTSMKFWANATQFLDDQNHPTPLANCIFGSFLNNPLDEFAENPSWFVHWNLCKSPSQLTVFWYVFNLLNVNVITRSDLNSRFEEYVKNLGRKVSSQTLQRDVDVLLRSYVPMLSAMKQQSFSEDLVEPFLSDLNIITVDSKDVLAITRSDRPTLNNSVFAYSLMDFWLSHSANTASLDFTRIAYDDGSPGKVFKLDEESIIKHLETLQEITSGALLWTEQSGIRTLIRRDLALKNPEEFMMRMVNQSYS